MEVKSLGTHNESQQLKKSSSVREVAAHIAMHIWETKIKRNEKPQKANLKSKHSTSNPSSASTTAKSDP